ncbi:MAG: hypothetical protein OHK0017_07800 [Patescibacteria group bacterium]
MVECYSLPTAKPYLVTARLVRYIDGVKQVPITLKNVVFYEQEGRLENELIGITSKVQISQSILPEIPGLNDIIIICNTQYKFINPTLKRNPAFRSFWQSEVKEI